MNGKRAFFNPFRMLGLKPADGNALYDELHSKKVAESSSLEEALLIVMSKIIESTRLLSKCIVNCTAHRVDRYTELAREIHQQEEILTKDIISSDVTGSMLKSLLTFPHRLARIGDLLDVILECCRVKTHEHVEFSDRTEAELDQLFLLLLDMMTNTRDAFNTPDETLLKSISSESRRLGGLLEDFRLAYWQCCDNRIRAADSSPLYLDILNAIGAVAEHLEKMCRTLLELKRLAGIHDERGTVAHEGLRSLSYGAES
ncbi:MAG: hypothetical protein LDL33_12870 [Desulfomonile sp.]|nr:hypothetical protein [Desulfomonile sp.]